MGAPSDVAWLPWTLLIPLLAAVLAFLLDARARRALTLLSVAALIVCVAGLAWQVWRGGPQTHHIGGWGAPLGIDLYADGLSVLMLLMSAAVSAPVSYYALGYFMQRREARHFWPLFWFLWAALNALFLSADLFNLYVTLELLGLAAVALVTLAVDVKALRAGLRYLLAALSGSLLYLMGVALLYGAYGTLALSELAALRAPTPAAWLAAALMSAGLLLKTALFPLHFWLPAAHGGAHAPVSALLSGLVIKASFYLLLRLWLDVFPAAPLHATQLLGLLGGAAIVYGSVMALRARRLKMLVAWSTVAQIGYLFLLFPLALDDAVDAYRGGVYQALAHALAKAAMFLAAGCIAYTMGTDQIEQLGGVTAQRPVSVFAFALAGVSIMGLPPSGGFIAKWLLMQSAVTGGQWWWAVVIIAGGLLSAAYVFRVLRYAFLSAPPDARYHALPHRMEWPALLLALGATALGLNATGVLALLDAGAPLTRVAP
ncbi:MAG: complex I subunit 5 family protein [Pseudomonadota bacterium]